MDDHICTEMEVPEELLALADEAAAKENPLNLHQITTGGPIPGGGDPSSLALPLGTLWENGRTLRVRILNSNAATSKIKGKIREYASQWMNYANLKLEFVESEPSEIRVKVDASNASWSYVGNRCAQIPAHLPTMTFGWLTDRSSEQEFARVILHEFGHALGCIHEHQSPAAGISWNKAAVYTHYRRQGWSDSKTDQNILDKNLASQTQFTEFDKRSIMIYAIPASLTTDGFFVNWDAELSQTDKDFIANSYPPQGVDIAAFNTLEVRSWDKPAKEAVKRQTFSKYDTPPTLAVGLTWLDVDSSTNVRVKAYADKVKEASADIHIDTSWDTTLYSAGCTWFRVAADDPDFQTGEFNTLDDHAETQPQEKTSRQITFDRPYAAPPNVVVWLNQFDIDNGRNWRINATASNITAQGFTINLDSWHDTVLYSATAAWIAYPADKAGVTSGTYSTSDVRPWHQPQLTNTGRVDFPAGKFKGNPKVLIALNSFDMDKNRNLRLKVSADSVSKDGMNWHIDSWYDSVLYAAGATYIAFE